MKKLLVSLILVSVVLVSLSGCLGKKDEKQAFIDATVEATCLVFQAENIFDPSLEEKAKDIYKKHGFDADDDEAMNALTAKYENDEDVQAAIAVALEECVGDLGEMFENAFGEMDVVVEEPAEESVEEPAE